MSCFTQDFSGAELQSFDIRTRYLDVSEFYECVTVSPCCDCSKCPEDKMFYITGDEFVYNFNFEVQTVKLINPEDNTEIAEKTGSWKTGAKQVTVKTNDTSGANCFIVKINDDCCLCFLFEEAVCTDDLILIESFYRDGSRDCFGNKYGSGYSNQMRIKATVLHKSYEYEFEQNQNDEVTKQSNRQLFNIDCLQYFQQNGYQIRALQEVVLMGQEIKITLQNGEELFFDFYTESGLSSQTPDFSDRWLPRFVLRSKKCELFEACN